MSNIISNIMSNIIFNTMSNIMSNIMCNRNLPMSLSNMLPASLCSLMKMKASFETSLTCYHATGVMHLTALSFKLNATITLNL